MKKLLYAVLFLSILILGACGGAEEKEQSTQNETTNETTDPKQMENEEPEKGEENESVYFKDNEAKLVDLKIKITETKVIQPGEPGNEYSEKPVLAFWYETTNLSDKDIDPSTAWIVVFSAIQDNNPNSVNELEMGSLPDDRFLDTQLETIKKDGTVENAVAYELDDLETPVTLVATQGFGGEELGRQDFEVKQ